MILREDLPELPSRMRSLPISPNGYPVPYFVAWIDGVPDFRVANGAAIEDCVRFKRCWLCGQKLGRYSAFVIGPMCAVNRISPEPPAHRECATYAVRACPFLTNPSQRRRPNGLPEDGAEPAGCMIKRNPGVSLVWVTTQYRIRITDRGVLFDVGEPKEIEAYREGRHASFEEVLESVQSGLPELERLADGEEKWLTKAVTEALGLLTKHLEAA